MIYPWAGFRVAAWRRGRLPGRHGLKCRLDRPIRSGSYARAGYLKTLVRRRACILETGATRLSLKSGCPQPLLACPWMATRRPSDLLAAPRQPPGAFMSVGLSPGWRPPSRTRRARARPRSRRSPSACRALRRGASSARAGAAGSARRSGRHGDPGPTGVPSGSRRLAGGDGSVGGLDQQAPRV